MAISTETTKSGPYACNGATTVFAYGFKVFSAGDLEVTLTDAAGNETVLTLTTDYTVSGVGADGGGSVTALTAYATGNRITIRRAMAYKQPTDLENQGAYYAQTIEDALDRTVMEVQQLHEVAARALIAPVSDSGTASLVLPAAAQRAGKLLGFDGAGNAAALAANDGSATAVTATGSSVSRYLADRFADVINVMDYGAVGDGGITAGVPHGTANGAAFNAAINAARLTGKSIHVPAGTYYFPRTDAPLDLEGGGLTFLGDGMEQTILLWETSTAVSENSADERCLFKKRSLPDDDSAYAWWKPIEFHDIQFQGLWGLAGYTPTTLPNVFVPEGTTMILMKIEAVRFKRVKWKNIVALAMLLELIKELHVTECVFDTVCRDSVHARNVRNTIVDRCIFKHSDDNAIAIGAQAIRPAATETTEVVIVTNNIFEDVCPAQVNACHSVIFEGNIFNRCQGGLNIEQIQPVYGPLDPMKFSVIVRDNILNDTLFRSWGSPSDYRSVIGIDGSDIAASSGVIPGRVDKATGLVTNWYQYRNQKSPSAGGQHLIVEGNIVARTLPAVAKYSDWGFGPRFHPTGFIDPEITDVGLRPDVALAIADAWRVARIEGNILANAKIGIQIQNNADYGLTEAAIRRNVIFDTVNPANGSGTGININYNATRHIHSIAIEDNIIDVDPYYLSSHRDVFNVTGRAPTWDGSYTSPAAALNFGSGMGLRVTRNHIKNAQFPVVDFNAGNQYIKNVVWCDPISDTAARGVGNIGDTRDFEFFLVDYDFASSTFGQPKAQMATEASAMPSSGTYRRGHFVRNSSPAFTTGGVVQGWVRLTTGSAHVLGTDWDEISAPNYSRSGTATLDPTSLADGAGATLTIPVTGAALGDFVLISAPYDLQGTSVTAYVSAANTVSVRIQNESGGTLDLASGTWRARVFK